MLVGSEPYARRQVSQGMSALTDDSCQVVEGQALVATDGETLVVVFPRGEYQ